MIFVPVYAVSVVVPLVVAVSVTLNAVPAVLVPATASATLSVGGAGRRRRDRAALARDPVRAEPRLAPCTSTWSTRVRPVSLQVTVGALTVQTVAVVGAVRRTTYWLGAGLAPPGAAQVIWIEVLLVAVAATEVGSAEGGAGRGAAAAAAGAPRGRRPTVAPNATNGTSDRARANALHDDISDGRRRRTPISARPATSAPTPTSVVVQESAPVNAKPPSPRRRRPGCDAERGHRWR